MSEKVAKLGLSKQSGFLYFLDKDGDVSRTVMSRGRGSGVSKVKPEKVERSGVKKEPGFLYFIDKDGDVSKAKMSRGR